MPSRHGISTSPAPPAPATPGYQTIDARVRVGAPGYDPFACVGRLVSTKVVSIRPTVVKRTPPSSLVELEPWLASPQPATDARRPQAIARGASLEVVISPSDMARTGDDCPRRIAPAITPRGGSPRSVRSRGARVVVPVTARI